MPGMMKKPMMMRRREMGMKKPMMIRRREMGMKKGGMVKSQADYDAKVAELDYPGTKGVSMPDAGKQQLTGKGFRGTF